MDASLVASRLPGQRRAYVIGPFANRVNFASQQRRALNLIWAINEDFVASGFQQGVRGKDIAIVGAGLSGLTASLGLASFQASSWIFEKADRPLETMLEAKHRNIHPSINYWPYEPIDPSTYLPFFNWHYDTCPNVLETILEEWKRLSSHLPSCKDVVTGCTVDSFKMEGQKWRINATRKSGAALDKELFDAVIVATGFGSEAFADNSDKISYWDFAKDPIRKIAAWDEKEASENGFAHHIISGSGDGGVIEVFRLLFHAFKAGGLETSLAALMSDISDLPSAIRSIERDIQKEVSDAVIHADFPPGDQMRDDWALRIWDEYCDLFKERGLAASFRSKLSEQRSAVEKVILLGRRASPLDWTLSPYHKVILTYCINEGLVDYLQIEGSADIEPSSPSVERAGVAERDVRLKVVREFTVECEQSDDVTAFSPPQERLFEKSFFLSRHGYQSPIDRFFPDHASDTAKEIRLRQALFADQDWLTLFQADHFALGLNATAPSQSEDWFHRHKSTIEKYFWENHRLEIAIEHESGSVRYQGYKTAEKGCFVLKLFSSPKRDAEREFEDNVWALPKRFLGLPINDNVTFPPTLSQSGFPT